MDVDCSLMCRHQENGKCILTDVLDASLCSVNHDLIDCLYFDDRE